MCPAPADSTASDVWATIWSIVRRRVLCHLYTIYIYACIEVSTVTVYVVYIHISNAPRAGRFHRQWGMAHRLIPSAAAYIKLYPSIYLSICLSMSMYKCKSIYIYIYICIYIYIYTPVTLLLSQAGFGWVCRLQGCAGGVGQVRPATGLQGAYIHMYIYIYLSMYI